jgi:hypothetical protein
VRLAAACHFGGGRVIFLVFLRRKKRPARHRKIHRTTEKSKCHREQPQGTAASFRVPVVTPRGWPRRNFFQFYDKSSKLIFFNCQMLGIMEPE